MLGTTGGVSDGPSSRRRYLTVWTAERVSLFPDVSPLKEVGLPFVFDSPFGFAGPKGMDPKVVQKLHDALTVRRQLVRQVQRIEQGIGRGVPARTTASFSLWD